MSDPIAIRQYQYEYIYIWLWYIIIYTLWRMIARNVAAYDTLPESILTVTAWNYTRNAKSEVSSWLSTRARTCTWVDCARPFLPLLLFAQRASASASSASPLRALVSIGALLLIAVPSTSAFDQIEKRVIGWYIYICMHTCRETGVQRKGETRRSRRRESTLTCALAMLVGL